MQNELVLSDFRDHLTYFLDRPKGENAQNLGLMRRIDELFLGVCAAGRVGGEIG